MNPIPRHDCRTQLEAVKASIERLSSASVSHTEALRQLQGHQQRVMQIVTSASLESGLTPYLVPGDGGLLFAWQRMARALEPHHPSIPRVADIADMQVPDAASGWQPINIAPDERVGAWIEHALAVVDALLWTIKDHAPNKADERFRTPFMEFDDAGGGREHLSRSVPDWIAEVESHLGMFLLRLDACERSAEGAYFMRDSRAGTLHGMKVLWDHVWLSASGMSARLLIESLEAEFEKAKSLGEVLITTIKPPLRATPLTDAMAQLTFALATPGGVWPTEIPLVTVEKLRAIARELPYHRAQWERWEPSCPSLQTEELTKSNRAQPISEGGVTPVWKEKEPVSPFSPDFRTCTSDGITFHFTRSQAACMKAMWELSLEGKRWVAQESVFEQAIESMPFPRKRLDHVFRSGKSQGVQRMHPAWQTILRKDPERRGFYQLVIGKKDREAK